MKIKYSAITDKGRYRTANEDSFLCNDELANYKDFFLLDDKEIDLQESAAWFAVADGMGGHEAGEIASRITLEKLYEIFSSNAKKILEDETLFKNSITRIHEYVNQYGNDNNNAGMGCTLTGMLFNTGRFILFNVGDSRVYLLRNGYLQQKTKDHSLKEQTNLDVAKNYIISSIGGGSSDIIIDIYDMSGQIRQGDVFIAASDGLTDFELDDNAYDQFEKIVSENTGDLKKMVSDLLNFSLTMDSKDNITAIAVKIVAE